MTATAIKTEDLLKVKTIAKSMVRQIEVVKYETSGDATKLTLFQRIQVALVDEIKPLGWVPGEVIPEEKRRLHYSLRGFWLVYFEGRYRWIVAPEGGALARLHPSVEQLFV